jgi:small subunit ribosomal protein S11
MAKMKSKTPLKISKKSRLKERHPISKIYLSAKQNNSIVTLTDLEGKVIAWSSSGKSGFKGAKKSTPFAAQKATEEVLEKAKIIDSSSFHVIVKGAGQGRDAFLRAIQASGIQIESIKDTTGFPFGGPKAKNRRRV